MKGFTISILLGALSMIAIGCEGASPTRTSIPSPTTEPVAILQSTATSDVSPEPASTVSNFHLLISDDRLAIGDFNELLVTIEKVSVQQAGASGLIEFDVPEEDNTADLTKLQGEYALEILKVQLDEGEYAGVVVQVGEVTGVLAETGDSITLKLPSSKIKINKHFGIYEGVETTFVFDIAVVAAGNEKNPKGIKYILHPVIRQSGADQPYKVLATDAPTADAGEHRTVATGENGTTAWLRQQRPGGRSSHLQLDPLHPTG